jgi:hypothetical protein
MSELMTAAEARRRGERAQAKIDAQAAELVRQAGLDDARRQADERNGVEILTDELLDMAADTITIQVSYNSHQADLDSRYGEIEQLIDGHPKDNEFLDDRWLAWDRVEVALTAKGYQTHRSIGLLPYPDDSERHLGKGPVNGRVVVTLQVEW